MFDLDSVRELFKTESNTAFFWSGLGENGIMKIIQSRNHYAEVTDTCCLWRGWFD